MNLTEKAVAKLAPGKKRLHVYDEEVTGFGTRVETNGRKSYFWFAKVNRKPRFRALGEYPTKSVSEARAEARKLAGQASAWKLNGFAGTDPFEKVTRATPAGVPTFKQLVDAYVEHIREKGADEKRPAEKIARAVYQAEWAAKHYFQDWFGRPMDQITLDDVTAAKRAQGSKRYAANRCVELIRSMYAWSSGTKDGKVRFHKCGNPAAEVESYKEEKRVRYLDEEEMLRVNEALESEPSEDLRDVLICLLWTGARRSDVFSMRWADVKLGARTWRVPFPKGDEAYTVDLLPEVVAVLERRRTRISDSEAYVFPGAGKTGHLIDLKKQWNAFRKRAKLENFRLHDFRHTCASMQASAGVPLLVIKENLGHRSLQSTERYSHLLNEVKLEAREAGRAKMLSMMKVAKRRAKDRVRQPKLLKAKGVRLKTT